MYNSLYLVTIVSSLFLALSGFAQSGGDPDLTFNAVGYTTLEFGFQDNLTDVKVQADQKILACGTALTASFSGQLLVLRFLPDGMLDTSFGTNGQFIVDEFQESYAYEMQVLSDGKILVAGAAANPNFIFSALVLRLLPNGTLDPSFGNNGYALINPSGADHFAFDMGVQSDGTIVLAGYRTNAAFNQEPVVFALTSSGMLDTTFGTDGFSAIPVSQIDNRFNALTITSDDKIVAAGHRSNPITQDGQTDFDILVAQYTSNGSPDVSFSQDGAFTDTVSVAYSDDIFDVMANSSGEIFIGGYTTASDFGFDAIALKYNSTGQRITTFGNNGVVRFNQAPQDVAYAMTLTPEGDVLLAGTTGGFFFANSDVLLLKYSANGTLIDDFGQNGVATLDVAGAMDEANGMILQADGKIVIAGKANTGANNDVLVARFHSVATGVGIYPSHLSEILLYPNPVKRGTSIHAALPYGIERLVLTDLSGREIPLQCPRTWFGQPTVDITIDCPAGMYLLRINDHCEMILVE